MLQPYLALFTRVAISHASIVLLFVLFSSFTHQFLRALRHPPSSPWGHTTTSAVIFDPVDPKPTQRPIYIPIATVIQLPQSYYGRGLILPPAEAPIPQIIVEMRELLADNISLLEQLHSIHAPGNISVAGPSRPRMRDVPLWLYCFLTYTAILTTDQPTKDKLAYARLMILEASRHGHLGWLDYDCSFRQQAAANPSLPWNTLSPALHATNILGNFTGKPSRLLCSLCRGVDHTRNKCALAYLHPKSHPPPPTFMHTKTRVCNSWNRGSCIYPGTCTYNHVCATCPGAAPHPVCECPKTPSRGDHSKSLRKRIPLN